MEDDNMHLGEESSSAQDISDVANITCNPCSDEGQSNNAAFYCLDCEEYLCERCKKRHKERKATRDHAPIASQEYNEIMNKKLQFQCDPCKEEGKTIAAEFFCNLCDEQLCNKCSNDHRKRKATTDHILFPISEKIEKELELSKIFCTICKEDHKNVKAEYFCNECDEHLCCACSKRHTTRKATKTHTLTNVKEIQERQAFSQFTCDECDEENMTTTASGICNECAEYLCLLCSKKHNSRKASKSHIIEDIKTENKELLPCTKCELRQVQNASAFYCDQCLEHLCQACARKHKTNTKTETHEIISSLKFLEEKKNRQTCNPCDLRNEVREAVSFCTDCEEYLCDICDKQHKVRKVTKNHEIVKITDMNEDLKKNCDPCNLQGKEKKSESFCNICEEFLCNTCAQAHSVQKATKDHILESIFAYRNKKQETETASCDVCINQDITVAACTYCKECQEKLCESCTRIHQTQKATKYHMIIEVNKEGLEYPSNLVKMKMVWCKPCTLQNLEVEAKTHCADCNEDLCDKCTNTHRRIPGAATHSMIKIEKRISSLPVSVVCDQCSVDKKQIAAVKFCEECNQHLCDPCTKMHKSLKLTKEHNLTAADAATFTKAGTGPVTSNEEDRGNFPYNKTYKTNEFPSMSAPVEHKVSSQSIAISWMKPPESELKIKHFEIQYRTAIVQSQWKTEKTNGIQTTHTIENLASGTAYEFQIRVKYDVDGEVYGPFSPTSAHMITNQATLGKPTLVEALGDKVTIKWETDAEKKSSISHYEIRYRKTGETKWQVTSTDDSKDIGTVEGLQGNTTYEFKVRPIFDDGEGPYGPVSDHITTKTPHPGKPVVVDVATDSITIKWKKPEGGTLLIKSYDIRFRMTGEDQWRVISTLNAEQIFTVKELKGSTKYEFQVRAVYDDMEGQYGLISDHIKTETTLARKLKGVAKQIPGTLDDGQPERYKVPIVMDEKSVNSNAKFRRCIFGTKTDLSQQEKTIMLVGATGSGKSTLIDGMINYIFDVAWDDEFRYSLIDLMQDEKKKSEDQALSQTEWITNYTINHTDGCQIYYTLNIIDTPGFGDTRGITRDKKIVDQMRELFATRGERGVATIDAVCFVTQAPMARLSPTQKYIFESILSLFGRDIKENIFILITFADGNKPPVLDALAKAEIPFVDKFVFNNSALFASKQADFAPMFWKMGKESFKKFFMHLHGAKTKSLQMTSAVLNERNNLETTVQGLRPQISDGLNKLEVLRQTRKILKQHKADIEANKNFNYEVKETRQRQINLDLGVFVTNCLVCNRTCHFPCHIPRDDQKSGCAVMKEGHCTVCPKTCRWDSHKNNPYRFETYTEVVKRTYDELKQNYENATGKAQTSRQLLQSIKNDFDMLRKKVGTMVEQVRKSLNRLSEIALKPNPLSNCEYIDLLIETEKQEGKEGFQSRITMLSNLRKDAELIEKVPEGTFEPWGEVAMSDIEEEDEEVVNEKLINEKKKKGNWFTNFFVSKDEQ